MRSEVDRYLGWPGPGDQLQGRRAGVARRPSRRAAAPRRRLRPQGVPLATRSTSAAWASARCATSSRGSERDALHRVRSRRGRRCRRRAARIATGTRRSLDRARCAPRRDRGQRAAASVRPTRTSSLPVPVVGGAGRARVPRRRRRAARREVAGHVRRDRGARRARTGRTSRSSRCRTASRTSRCCCAAFANVYGICVMAPTAHLEPGVVRRAQRADPRAPRHRPLPDRRRRRPPTTIAAALSRLRLRVGAAARHHAVEVHEAADEPRQRGRRDVPPGDDAGELVRRARAEGVAMLDAAGIDVRVPRGGPRARRADLLDGAADRGRGARRRLDAGRASPAAPARSRSTTSTARSCGMGRCQGRDTPVNAALCELANRMAREQAPHRGPPTRRPVLARTQVSWRSSCSSASSSETSRAKLSSETRMPRARTSIAFSPADSPFVTSRSARFRTTSATW